MVIKNLRLKNGWSQEKLSEITKLSTRTIQRIEKNDTGSKESLLTISSAFKIDISQLIKNIDENNSQKEDHTNNVNDKRIIIYLTINFLLFFINITTNPEYLWFFYPLLGWGIPLFYKKFKNNLKR